MLYGCMIECTEFMPLEGGKKLEDLFSGEAEFIPTFLCLGSVFVCLTLHLNK